MKKLLVLLVLLAFSSCTPMKRAQTGLARSIAGQERIKVDGYEVYCSEGKVCSEIDVLSISMENRDKGKVRVTFKNRTGNTALFQVRLEIRDPAGAVTETRPENIAIPPTQELSWEMPGVAKQGGTVRVLMNTAY
ncbi:MAG TPA: hypothetical protein VEK06_00115 [Myxococcota bacterium]|nr:hypothetical protein [Myxococcota bacterium]